MAHWWDTGRFAADSMNWPRDAAKQSARDVGMVFQLQPFPASHRALGNVVEAPVQVKKVKKSAAVERARDLLNQVGLSEKADAYPRNCPAATAAGGDRPCAGDGSQTDALRRTHVSGPRIGRRSSGCDEKTLQLGE